MSGRLVTSDSFQKRPLYVQAINRAMDLLPRVSLDKDQLLRLARKRSGLRDFGPGYWEEPLDVLLRSIEEEADLSPLGRFMIREQLAGRLEVRLRAEAWFRQKPEILEQELLPVWLIAGLQRTGTTKLQRLLGADPDNRSLLSWESMFPAPLHPNWKEQEKRLPKTRTAARAMRFLAPDFFAIHPVQPLAPEEDVLLLDVSFMSTSWEAMLHVPSYADWLERAEQGPAYAYELRLLKLLQWQRPGKRWVLKSPHHLEWLDVVRRTYPDVHVIWPHRTVTECIPSFMSMVAHGRAMFGRRVDARQAGRHWLRKNRIMLEKALDFREQKPEFPIVDVHYKELVRDAPAVIEKIYQQAGADWSTELKESFIRAESDNDHRRYGIHQYRVEDFGLSASDVLRETRRYTDFLQQIASPDPH